MNTPLSTFIAFCRWFSAFLVVFGHSAHILIINQQAASSSGLLVHLLYVITSLGHSAVMVFFVVSGYLVGGLTLDKWLTQGPDIVDYAINRFSRIYVVLIPALIVGYALDQAGLHWFNSAELYTNSMKYDVGSLSSSVEMRLGLKTFIGNFFMLETVAVDSLGSNGPLWSLAFEWWYYCLFCLAVGGVLSRGWQRVIMFLALLALCWVLPANLFLWMLIWLMGIATYFVTKKINVGINPAIGGAVLIGAVILAVISQNPDNLHHPESLWVSFARDCLVAIAFCFALMCFSRAKRNIPLASFHHWAASFSYTIYLIHFPAMLMVVAMANHILGWPFLMQPTVQSVAYLILLTVVLYIFGYIFSIATERHTEKVKLYIKQLVARLATKISLGIHKNMFN